MGNSFKQTIIEALSQLGRFFWKNTVGRIALLVSVATVLQTFGVWESLLYWLTSTFSGLLVFLNLLHFGVPTYYWIGIIVLFLIVIVVLSYQVLYLKLVSGEFMDDFKYGLGKWNYGNEGWTIEKEGEDPVLSVMNSDLGGITQSGLWDEYLFSFENKILGKGKIGWLVKARDRSNYMMLQFVIVDTEGKVSEKGLDEGIYIRPHFRHEGGWVIWPHEHLSLSESLQKIVRRYNWFKVSIQVRGNTVDVYIEGEHVYHLYLDDPLRIEKIENLEYQNEQGKKVGNMQVKKLNVFSYSQGRVGFRCAPTEEHAHIRKVQVKPTW